METEEAINKIVEDALTEMQNSGVPSAVEADGRQVRGLGSRRMKPLLNTIRLRVRDELAKRQPLAPIRRRGQQIRSRIREASQLKERVTGQVTSRIRRGLTGQAEKRVRDFAREKLAEPPVIRLRDKISFMFGVLGCFVVEAWAILMPSHFSYCFALFIIPLLIMRVYLYASAGWQYFLIDFCYFANVSCLGQIALYPTSAAVFRINFLLVTGPLAMAVPTWRNSLVFHSLDRVTSSYIHVLPPLFAFCVRWFPPDGLALDDDLPLAETMRGAVGFYLCWQAFYLAYTEWVFPPAAKLDTSIRVLASGKPDMAPPACYSGITNLSYRAVDAVGVMRQGERFDAEQWKTKLIFVSVQFAYTLATLGLACALWGSRSLHLGYMLSIIACNVWNGGSYYIEVFSKAYSKQFEGVDAEARRRLQMALMVNGDLPEDEESLRSVAEGKTPLSLRPDAEVASASQDGEA
jgi:hypothetical protein